MLHSVHYPCSVEGHWRVQSGRGPPLPLHTAEPVPAGGQLEVQADNPRGN